MVAGDLHAGGNENRRQSEMRFGHVHCEKVQHGMQHNLQTMGMHGVHVCHGSLGIQTGCQGGPGWGTEP